MAKLSELFRYPGDGSPRVRWETRESRTIQKTDYAAIRKFANDDLTIAIKEAKTLLKDPLATRSPLALVSFSSVGNIGDNWAIEDVNKQRLSLTDEGENGEPATLHLLPLLPPAALNGQTMLIRFHYDLLTHDLRAKPLSLVTSNEIIRLSY